MIKGREILLLLDEGKSHYVSSTMKHIQRRKYPGSFDHLTYIKITSNSGISLIASINPIVKNAYLWLIKLTFVSGQVMNSTH